jgi:hypothetical protein
MAFLGFFKRQQTPEKTILKWWIDVQIPGTDHYTGFYTQEISTDGRSLVAANVAAFANLVKDGITTFRIRIPGQSTPLTVGASWNYTQETEDECLTEWTFTNNASQARKTLKEVLTSAHQVDIRRCA